MGAEFAAETGLSLELVEGSVQRRVQIRQWVVAGQIQQAIDDVIALHPNFVSEFPDLHFELLSQLLIEMIRENRMDDGLRFSHSQLGPLARTNSSYLSKIERMMALLVFGSGPGTWTELLELRQRERLGDKLNQVLLTREGLPKDSLLSTLLKRFLWLKEMVNVEKIALPSNCVLDTSMLQAEQPDPS